MDADRTDKLILGLPRKDKIRIIKMLREYMEELKLRSGKPIKEKKISLGGEKIIKRRILWLKKSLKKKN